MHMTGNRIYVTSVSLARKRFGSLACKRNFRNFCFETKAGEKQLLLEPFRLL